MTEQAKTEEKKPIKDLQRSPFAGCTIMIAIALVGLFVIGMAAYTLIRQNQEIDRFTESSKREIILPKLEGHEAELNALHERIEGFRTAVLADVDATHELKLSKNDLNFLLATAPILRDLAAQFSVSELRDGRIIAQHSRELNGMPGNNTKRYLNAEAVLRPGCAEKSLTLQIESLNQTIAPVAKEFIAQIPPYRIGLDLQNDPVFGPILSKITACEVVGDQFIIRCKRGEIATLAVDDQSVKSAFMRILRVLVLGFLVIVGIGLFIGMRALGKKRRESANQADLPK